MSRLADPMLAERRRRQILDAAMLCFRRRGFHQATMQEICSEAGISPGALYRYFGSKSDIIAAIAEDERDQRFDDFDPEAQGTVVDLISNGLRHYYQKIADSDHGTLMADILAEAARDPILARTFKKLDEERIAEFAKRLRKAQLNGEIDPTLDALTASQTLIAAIEGISFRLVFDKQADLEGTLAQIRSLTERYLARPC